MARGKNLTIAEKYSIKGMHEEGLPLKKMAMHLGRTEKFIKDYIDKNLPDNRTISAEDINEAVELVNDFISLDTENKVLNHLVKAGMAEVDAIAAVNRVRKQLNEPNDNVAAIVQYCLRNLSPKQLMVTKSQGRRTGVAVMTAAASSKTDDAKDSRTRSSGSKGAIFRQDGTVD